MTPDVTEPIHDDTEPTRTPARARAPRGRGRAPLEARQARPRRVAPESRHSERADLDGLYLAEMASSTVLTAEEEAQLGRGIVEAERELLRSLARSPAGARALRAFADDLEAGRLGMRDLLLNPDQEGLDLEQVAARMREALRAVGGEHAREAADVLADLRIEPSVVDAAVEALRDAASADPGGEDAAALRGVERARRDTKRFKERLVVGNLRLVVLFARKYLGRGVPLLDLVQEGNLGLMRAADKFDHRRGFRFSTYAAWWIKQALQRGLLDRSLRLPVHVADDRRRIGKVRAVFVAQHRREPTSDEIAALTNLGRERVETILSLPPQPASLDAPVGEEGEGAFGDLIASSVPPPDDTVALRALGDKLEGLLGGLTPREQQILRMRFGLGQQREHTLEEVGRALSLTRERIRQIERTALDKLRARSERIDLDTYLG